MKKKYILFSLVSFIALLTAVLYTNQYLQKPKALETPQVIASFITNSPVYSERIKNINQQLSYFAREKSAISPEQQNLNTQRMLAKERKNIMLSFLPENPHTFLNEVLPDEIRDNLPQELINEGLVETKKEFIENLEVIIEENIDLEKVNYKYKLNGKNLYLPEDSEPLVRSGEVSVLAYSLDNNLVVADPAQNIQFQVAVQEPVTGPQKLLVAVVQSDTDSSWINLQNLQTAVFGLPSSVNQYYLESSGGQMNLTGEIAPLISLSNLTNRCDLNEVTSKADSSLQSQGYNLPDYRAIIYYMPLENCGFSSFAFALLGGQKTWFVENDFFYVDTMIHELGHNLGMHHANTYECGAKSLGNTTECIDDEYGDLYDMMGHPIDNLFQFNGPHKTRLGWISSLQLQTVTGDGQITLKAQELTEPGLKIAKIWRNINNQFIYLSFRQRTGLDANLPEGIVNGVNLHLTDANNDAVKTWFIDLHPNSQYYNWADWSDGALADNETFVDEYANISIKQLSHTSSDVTLEIDIPDNYPPVIHGDTNIGGLVLAPAGSLYPYFAKLNQQLNPFVFVYDYSDGVTPVMEITRPDGSQIREILNTSPYTTSNLCREIKCFTSSDSHIIPDQLGSYQVIFSATDSQGAVSNSQQFDFLSLDPSAPTPTPLPSPTPSPSITPTPTPPVSDQLLLNPGFELDDNRDGKPDNWTTNKNFTRSAGRIHSGSYAGRHYSTANAGYSINQTVRNISGNTNYSFSGWTNIPETNDSFTYKIQLVWKNTSGSNLRTDTLTTYKTNTGGWKQTLASKISPANSASVIVRMNVASLNAYVFVDDFSLRHESL